MVRHSLQQCHDEAEWQVITTDKKYSENKKICRNQQIVSTQTQRQFNTRIRKTLSRLQHAYILLLILFYDILSTFAIVHTNINP
jgi:Fe2+ transport system protein B